MCACVCLCMCVRVWVCVRVCINVHVKRFPHWVSVAADAAETVGLNQKKGLYCS